MTQIAEAEARCPECKHTWKHRIHPSINVSLDPALKGGVLSGDVFLVRCPACGHQRHEQYECLYHDIQKGLMISLTGPDDLARKKEALAQGLAGLPTRELYRLRVVTTVQDLWEKIFVFDADLNDGIVELLKIILPGQNADLKGATLRFHALDDAGALAYVVLRPGVKPAFVAVPRDYYEAVATQAFTDLHALADARGEWLTIDLSMVGTYMMSKQKAP